MSWNKTEHNFGKILQQTSVTCEFLYSGDKSILPNIKCGCGCSTPKIEGNKIIIGYKTPVVPQYIIRDGKGYIDSSKHCTVSLKDKKTGEITKQVLRFKAQIHPK